MNLGKLLRIARWEVTKNAGGVDRQAVAIAALALAGLAVMAPIAVSQGVAVDEGIYRVGVDEDSPYHQVVVDDPTFSVRDPDPRALRDGEVDLLVRGTQVTATDTEKGRAAAEELRSAVSSYNDRRMDAEANQTAAFPVTVTLRYAERTGVRDAIAAGGDDGSTSDGTGGAGGDSGDAGGGTDGDSSDASGDADGGDGASSDDAGTADDTSTGGTGAGGAGGGFGGFAGRLTGDGASGSPSDIAPPFPFRSLVLAFLFVLPLNFIIQAYGSTMLSERLNRRGELLLVAPVGRLDIIGGKTLPYFSAAVAVATVLAAGLEAPSVDPLSVLLSVAAIVPIALLFLAATFLGAMFARSFKELTFVTVTVTVSLTSYAFVPAIFTDVTPIALISPLTLVVRNLQDQAVTLGEFAFSTLPPTLTAGVLFALGAGIYREEDMFTQRPIPLKALDALAARVHGKWTVALVSAMLLPLVFVAELVGVAVLFAIPEAVSIPAILVVVVLVEEVAKSLHVYAGYAHDRFAAGLVPALVVGTFSGVGFFVAEKLTLIVQVIGGGDAAARIPVEERVAFLTGAGLPVPDAVVFAALLLAPLALHVVTASISAVGASRTRRSYVLALVVAMGIHFVYNFTVVSTVGV